MLSDIIIYDMIIHKFDVMWSHLFSDQLMLTYNAIWWGVKRYDSMWSDLLPYLAEFETALKNAQTIA